MTRSPPRVVMDTNVVLSALIFAHGRLAPLRQVWQQSRCHALASQSTITELIRVLKYPKFKLTNEAQQELLADYLPFCTVVKIPAKPPKTPPCRDPHDVQFLELAIAGKADYLVTGDSDLLDITLGAKCAIVTAEHFLNELATA
jgi:putative PIN family toxin of toxin-antitoxin system